MAALAMAAKGSGRVFCLFAGARKGAVSSGAVASWRRECSSYSEQLSSNADMLLSQFISPYSGHIFGRHITGLCMKKQQEVAKNIKRARQLGFMSVTYKDPTFLSDPKVCSIKYPE
ncbi:28S ribosomal protein S18c, mitochondrial isoform X2 [Podarcis raffonei]|uniref:28S ribosomal protein S18c, mitochondrial isoform X2 n=1 Tax=Podarcis raffonei TaxID=65483 RepID=UPI002329359C|nr:28S ribosomal protein S18c, mitochondrial isoform X2 [Podarcis raffonei]